VSARGREGEADERNEARVRSSGAGECVNDLQLGVVALFICYVIVKGLLLWHVNRKMMRLAEERIVEKRKEKAREWVKCACGVV